MTKSILTNATSGATMNMTGAAKNTTVGKGGY